MATFVLDIDPMPCPRPRIARVGKFVRAYYPKAYDLWRSDCAEKIRAYLPSCYEPDSCGIEAFIDFYVTRPKTTKLSVPKPDIDNYIKSLFDACTTAGLWQDDAQVVTVTATKQWAPEGEPGHIVLTIEPEVSE